MDKKDRTINELKKYYRLKNRTIPNLKNKLDFIKYEMEGIRTIEYTDMPGQSGSKKISYRLENLIEEKSIIERNIKINQRFVDYIESALNRINSLDKQLLIDCYAKDKFEKLNELAICDKLNISTSTLYRRKKTILNNFTKDLFGR